MGKRNLKFSLLLFYLGLLLSWSSVQSKTNDEALFIPGRLIISFEDPFVVDGAAAYALRNRPCQSVGLQSLLPEIQIFVEGSCLNNDRLRCLGLAERHRFFGRYTYSGDPETKELSVQIIVKALHIDHKMTLQLKNGNYLYLFYDGKKKKLRAEQSLIKRYDEEKVSY